jgi:hypothetical protein
VEACRTEDAEAADIEGGAAIGVSIGCVGAAEGSGVVIGVVARLGSPNV